MNQDFAVIQGAFLLAEKLCLPSNLSSLQKEDWSKVGHPVLVAVREVCGQDALCAHPSAGSATAVSWIKKVVCVVWLKLLGRENDEEAEEAWKTSPFFSLQRGLPEVNRVVLLEAVRSMAAARIFASFLLHLAHPQICAELERLVQHVKSRPTREDDVRLFLDVWWELWKGKDEEEKSDEDKIETLFARQVAALCSASASVLPQAAKRLKLDQMDASSSSSSSPATDVLHILLYALRDLSDDVTSTELCLQALSVSFDALYTTFLIDQETGLSPRERLNYLSQVAVIKERNGEKLNPELVREAQRDLRASHRPSPFQSSMMTLGEALKMITELAQSWQSSGLLKQCDGSNSSIWAFKLNQSVQRILAALPEDVGEVEDLQAERNNLKELQHSLGFPAVEVPTEVDARVTATIIAHRLEGFHNFTALFASEEHWSAGEEQWMKCLEENRAAFQQRDALVRLAATVTAKLNGGGLDASQCKKLMTIAADIFTALSLEEKNRALADMLALSSRGFLSSSAPSALTERFEKELNMAFNCIIQGGGGASQGNLNTAVSLVARVAFQNPEAALRSCCHSAVFNKDAFALMANILQQLHGLRGRRARNEEAQAAPETMEVNDSASGSALLCACLRDITRTKSLSANEKEQLVKFVGLLLKPVITVDGEEKNRSFLSQPEVMNNFVLPGISALGQGSFDIDLSLQLLQAVLSAATQEPDSSWVMDCSPFPLLYVLAQLLNQSLRCWEQPPEGAVNKWSMDSRELLVSVLSTLGQLVGAHVAASPSSWSRALFWLHSEAERLDWTVRLYLKPVWGDHFKNEVPTSLLTVCDLPEQEWLGLDLPQYGLGTGLLAWMECCAVSDPLQATMLSRLSLDRGRADHMNMFSKGLLVALTQTLPWCSVPQWARLLRLLRELIATGRLHAPFSLEYVDFLPLLDLRRFSCDLRLSVLLLRVLQLLCGSSCSDWLAADGWAHVGRLYAHAVREIVSSVRAKLPPSPTKALAAKETSSSRPKKSDDSQSEPTAEDAAAEIATDSQMKEEVDVVPSQEVLFVLSQLFCHVQHIQVMMPGGQCEPLFLCSLEILSHYEAVVAAFPDASTPLENDNTRHFFSTITDNLHNQEMKAVLQQKIAQLVPSTA